MAKAKETAAKDEAQAEEIKLIEMIRDPEKHPAPHTALVHPEEVSNYLPGGWRLK